VIVRLDDRTVIYGRVADSIFNGLEAIGGFYECLHHIGVLIVFFIQERLFKSEFIKELYQIPSEKNGKKHKLDEKKVQE
jgi:hypothetical protein